MAVIDIFESIKNATSRQGVQKWRTRTAIDTAAAVSPRGSAGDEARGMRQRRSDKGGDDVHDARGA